MTPARVAPPAAPPTLSLPARRTLLRQPLVTARLSLSPLDPDDTDDLWEAIEASRWHLGRWLPWVPYNADRDATLRYAEASVSDWDAGRALRFTLREGGRAVGVVGLDSCVHLHRSAELGYWLRQDATGRGLMTEAAGAAVRFAFERMGLHRVRCAAATDNFASLRVIGRLGFRFEGIARQAELVGNRWLDHAVFARLATDG